jgi:hypothetical protein
MAAAEPAAPRDVLSRLGRAVWPTGRCGDGDLARAALKELERRPAAVKGP